MPMEFVVFIGGAPHIVKFYPAWIEMDLLRLPMKGGAYSFSGKYVLKTIDELKTDKKPLEGSNDDVDAIIIVSKDVNSASATPVDFNSISELSKYSNIIIGISWYSALKILYEYGILNETDDGNPSSARPVISADDATQTIVKKFFNLSQSSGNTSNVSKNYAKSVLVSFIHGVHAYLLVLGVETVPSLDQPVEERFEFITKYLDSKTLNSKGGNDVAKINGIWQTLCKEILNTHDQPANPTEILKDTEKLDAFIKMTKDDGGNNVASIRSGEDLDNIAYLYGISGILLKFDEDE